MLINDTVAAISTPPGVGGIAVIRISGENALEIAEKVFRPANKNKKLSEMAGYRAAFGGFYAEDSYIDEGIALLFKKPHSYTGEDVVELSCHGGEVIARQLLLACFAAGASLAEPGEFTKRAVLNGRMDLAQAEAVIGIINAKTRQTAAMAGANLAGSLQKAIDVQKEKLIALQAHMSALIDFPEEDVENLELGDCLHQIEQIYTELQQMVRAYGEGAALRRGIQAVIVGSPNVGKSTLFNLMAGFERAIVTPRAGTTRDVITESLLIGGIPVRLADTAGIHKTEDDIEAEGIRRSLEEVDSAGLVIAVFDGTRQIGEAEREIIETCKDRTALAIINKNDQPVVLERAALANHFVKVVEVSAQHSKTKEIIEAAVKEILHIQEPDPNLPVIISDRQLRETMAAKKAMEEAKNAINNGMTYDIVSLCLEEALEALAAITGESATEAVMDEVFEKFCVGK